MLMVRSSCGHSSTTKVSPSCTVCPSRTRISFTAPARGASTGISIFMDSSTITGSPAATLSPTFAVTWKTTPVMCALISSAMERSLFDHLSVHPAAAEIRVRRDRAEQRQRRLDALDHAGVQCPRQALDRPGAVGAERDQLEEQRVVVNGDDAALDDTGLDPDRLGVGQRQPCDRTRRGQEILRRVLRVDAHLDGGAALLDLVLRERQRLAGRHAQLRGHQVEAGDFFVDRMLHLEPGVHLEKVEAALRVHQELERARIDVSDGARARDRGVRQPALGLRLEVRRRRLLHELLMTPLDRALALVQVDDAALRVAEDLDLDVARRLEIALDVDLGAAEGALRAPRGGRERAGELAGARHLRHADAAAAGGRLEDHRIADLAGHPFGGPSVRDRLGTAGHDRHARGGHAAPRLRLVAHGTDRLRRRSDEGQARLHAGLGEAPVLREEAVAGMHGVGAGFAGGGEDALDAEVRLARRRRPEQHRAIRVLHVGRVAVGLGIDGDGGEPERAAAAEDATRDLPAIGDEDGAEHAQGAAETGSVETRSPAAMRQPDAVGVQRSCTNPIARGLSIRTLTIRWRPMAASPTTRVPVMRPASGARTAVSASRAAGSAHAAAPAPSPDSSAVRRAASVAARSAGREAGSKSGWTWTRSVATTSGDRPSSGASKSGAGPAHVMAYA